MHIPARELPPLTVAQLKTCKELPPWLTVLLEGRPDDELCSVLYEQLCKADDFRFELPALVGLGSLLGLVFNPAGSLLGGLGGLLYGLADRPALARRGLPTGSARRFADWLRRPGPPFSQSLEGGEWLDRRYPLSRHVPLCEVRRDSQGTAMELHFQFHELDIRCCLQHRQIKVLHPSGESRTFSGTAHYFPDLIVYSDDLGLRFQLDGSLQLSADDPYSVGYHYPYCEDTGSRAIGWSQARDRLPFPPEWIPTDAVANETCPT